LKDLVIALVAGEASNGDRRPCVDLAADGSRSREPQMRARSTASNQVSAAAPALAILPAPQRCSRRLALVFWRIYAYMLARLFACLPACLPTYLPIYLYACMNADRQSDMLVTYIIHAQRHRRAPLKVVTETVDGVPKVENLSAGPPATWQAGTPGHMQMGPFVAGRFADYLCTCICDGLLCCWVSCIVSAKPANTQATETQGHKPMQVGDYNS